MKPATGRAARYLALVALLAAGHLFLPAGGWGAVVFGLGLAVLAVAGTGRLLVRLLPDLPSLFMEIALSAVLGWAVLGTVLALTGMAGWLNRWVVAGILAAGATAGPAALARWNGLRRAGSWRYWPLAAWSAVGVQLTMAVLVLPALLRPPAGYPGQAWAAPLPVQWAMAGEVWGRPGLYPSMAPALHLVWRAAGECLAGERLAALIGILEVVLAALGAAVVVRGILQRGWAAALLAGTAFATLPLLALTAVERGGGLAATGAGLAALWALLHSGGEEADPAYGRHWAVVAGILLGFALSCGWSAWPLVPAVLVVGAVHRPAGERRPQTLGRLGLTAFLALIPPLPWMLRSVFLTGNPVYPHLFGGGVWDETAAEAAGRSFVLPPPPVWILGGGGEQAVLGPLMVLLLVLAVASPVLGDQAIASVAAAGILAAGWVISPPDPGWLLPLLGIVAALGGTVAARVRRRFPLPGKVLLVVLLCLGVWQVVPLLRSIEAARFGLFASTSTVLEARSPRTDWLRAAGRAAPPDAKILLIGETRPLGLRRRAVWGTRADPSPVTLMLREAKEAAGQEDLAFRAALRREGVTHLLVSPRGALHLDAAAGWNHFREMDGARWGVIFQYLSTARQVWGDGSGNSLWALRPESPAREVEGP